MAVANREILGNLPFVKYYHRHLEDKLTRYANQFKVVVLVGARQVGKSTLVEKTFPTLQKIVFDPVQDLHDARKDPDGFLDTFPAPIILDEVQYAPELLPAIKRRVDLKQDKGQYFLTGSHNFSVLRDVAESMAGRAGILRIDGFTPAELLNHSSEKSWLSAYLDPVNPFDPKTDVSLCNTAPALHEYLWQGQLPEVSLLTPESVPDFYSSYVQTYVERDVRRMADISDLRLFGLFLRLCAALSGQEINHSQIGRELGIHHTTAKKWLHLLAGSYQWMELPGYTINSIKKLTRKPKGHVQDSGLACYLNAISTPSALKQSPLYGHLFESWGVNWISRQAARLPLAPHMYHWRTQNGAEVDVVLEYNGRLYPIEFKASEKLTRHDARGIFAFQKTYPNASNGIIIYSGSKAFRLCETTSAIPWNAQ